MLLMGRETVRFVAPFAIDRILMCRNSSTRIRRSLWSGLFGGKAKGQPSWLP